MTADRSVAGVFMQPDAPPASGGSESAGALVDSLLESKLGLLIFGADAMSVLQLRNAVLRGVAERDPRVEIVHARPDEDVIVAMSRKLGEACLHGEDLHTAHREPVKVLVISGRIADAVAPMRQLLRIAGTFPGLGVRVLVTLEDHPSGSPPPEFDTFGAGLRRHHCQIATAWSFAAPDMLKNQSVRESLQAFAQPDRSPSINSLAKGCTEVTKGAPEGPPAVATSQLPTESAFARPAPAQHSVFSLGALVGIVLLALTMVFLMFPRHTQTMRSMLLPEEARLAPSLTKDRPNATGVSEGTDPARERHATASTARAQLPPPDRPEAPAAGLTFADHAPPQLFAAEKVGHLKPDVSTDALSAIPRTESGLSLHLATSLKSAIAPPSALNGAHHGQR